MALNPYAVGIATAALAGASVGAIAGVYSSPKPTTGTAIIGSLVGAGIGTVIYGIWIKSGGAPIVSGLGQILISRSPQVRGFGCPSCGGLNSYQSFFNPGRTTFAGIGRTITAKPGSCWDVG